MDLSFRCHILNTLYLPGSNSVMLCDSVFSVQFCIIFIFNFISYVCCFHFIFIWISTLFTGSASKIIILPTQMNWHVLNATTMPFALVPIFHACVFMCMYDVACGSQYTFLKTRNLIVENRLISIALKNETGFISLLDYLQRTTSSKYVCPQLMKINILHPNNKLIGPLFRQLNEFIDRMLVRNVSILFYCQMIAFNLWQI